MSGTVIIGSTEWKADLQQFGDAIKTIESKHDSIEKNFNKIVGQLSDLSANWSGPAGIGLLFLINPVQTSGQQMVGVIGDVISAMKTTLQNYEHAENANAKNLSH